MANLVKTAFGSSTAYEILGVDKSATAEQIKRAYYKKALQWVRVLCSRYPGSVSRCLQHPDKNPGNVDATAKFQALAFVHSVLSDSDKRKEYDLTVGCSAVL